MEIRDLIIDRTSMTKDALCKKAKITRPTLDNLMSENPKHAPSIQVIKKVCKALNVNYKDYV